MNDFKDQINFNETMLARTKDNVRSAKEALEESRKEYLAICEKLAQTENEILKAGETDKYKLALMYKQLLAVQREAADKSDTVSSYAVLYLKDTVRVFEIEHEIEKLKELI